jgi:hypothetical protein
MKRASVLCAALIVVASCSKNSDDQAKSGPAGAPSATPGAPATPAAASGGATKWFALTPLHIEAEMPACSEVSADGSDAAIVIAPGGPSCTTLTLGFHDMGTAAETLDDRIKILQNGTNIEITRKDKLPDGWIVEYKQSNRGDSAPKLAVYAQYKTFTCLGDSFNADEAAAQRHACASMRDHK